MQGMTQKDEWLKIESLDMEAQGVAHNSEGKVVFVEGALPGEEVQVQVGKRKNQWEQASYVALRHESAQRVRPGCPHFGLHAGACGGCKMQHLEASSQVAIKQRVLEDNLAHLGKVKPERVLRPIEGPTWGYRFRARLSVRYVARKETVLVGFHERKSRYVADMSVCPVLPPHVSAMELQDHAKRSGCGWRRLSRPTVSRTLLPRRPIASTTMRPAQASATTMTLRVCARVLPT